MSAITFFWGPRKENGFLSNWFPVRFDEKGVEYTSVEHYMMTQKALLFGDQNTAKKIMMAKTPKDCKNLGGKISNFDLDTWYANRMEIVKRGIWLKFSQNPDLLDMLLSTKNNLLAEASPFDRVWGIGLNKNQAKFMHPDNWIGQNLLGKILMELRYWFYQHKQRKDDIVSETAEMNQAKRMRSIST
jgi:ribA/ribD-fused uncharacterized protein